MAISFYAQKLLNWFSLYKITPTVYDAQLTGHPHAQRRGKFVTSLAELVSYEAQYGYFTF